MKRAGKFILGLLMGCLIVYFISGLIVVIFRGLSWGEYNAKFLTIGSSEWVAVILVAVGALILSFVILVLLHELGHLVAGLLTGYKFVSFRIFNFTILREEGKLRVKKFALADTVGQCLLTPTDLPLEKIPVGWYNFGGIFVNLIILAAALPLLFLNLNPFVAEALGVFVATDALLLIFNGIPMQIGGVGNDAYNLMLLKKSRLSKLGMINQLRSNALIQSGVRPKDMPTELFTCSEEIDYKNSLEVVMPMMFASRLIDEMRYSEALQRFEALYAHKDKIMLLFVREIACELAFLYLRAGDQEKARALLDGALRKYIEMGRKTMSSKERICFAIAFYLDGDEAKAREIYENVKSRQADYLLQGEVKSDLALMDDALS